MATTASRTIAALAAVGALTLSLAGCVTGSQDRSSSTPTAGGSTGEIAKDHSGTVRIIMESVNDTDVIESLIPEFNKEYPNISIDIDSMVYDQMRDKIVASVQSPEPAYDLFATDNPWFTDFSQAGFLQPLDERIAATPDFDNADYFQPLLDITTVDGVQYGVPYMNYAVGYVYRKDVFADAGLEVPGTLDELVTTVKSLTKDGKYGIALQPQRGYKIMEEWVGWLFAAGGSVYDAEGNASLDTPEAHKALEAYIDVFNNAAPKNSLNWMFDDAQRSVASGDSASLISYNFALPLLNEEGGISGDRAGEFTLVPMIGGKSVLGSWSWSIPTNSGDPDAAWAFVSWLGSKDVDAQRVIAGGSPVRESTLEREDVLTEGYGADYLNAIKAMLANSDQISHGANSEEMIQAVGTELNEAVAGTKSVDQALKDANAAIIRIQGE